MGGTFETQVINEEILKNLSLKKRYAWIRANLMVVITDEEINFFDEVSRFCLRMEKEVNHWKDDVYAWIPRFGEKGYINRSRNYPEIGVEYGDQVGLTFDLMRYLAIDSFDPQFNMGMGASVLAINPVKAHHENRPICLEALKDMITGKSAGAILITEPERGSDAVHQLTRVTATEDGGLLIDGVKAFNTNAPKARWLVGYGTEDPQAADSGNRIAQYLIRMPDPGVTIERIYIPWVPKLWLGKETLTHVQVPKDQVLGGIGKGRDYMFEGLVPERVGIAMLNTCQTWGALAYASLYANMRLQFGKPILTLQGAGFTICEWWARAANFFQSVLRFCEQYDIKMKKYENNLPPSLNQALVASASQLKFEGAQLAERVCYEMANLMGGAGVCDNTLMQDYLGVSRIQEVVGGTRQIQEYILSMAQRQLFKMT